MSTTIAPLDSTLRPMLALRLHDSLVAGLSNATGVRFCTKPTLTLDDAERLDAWARTCANPTGQRAELARGIAALVRVGNGATIVENDTTSTPTTFWEATAR